MPVVCFVLVALAVGVDVFLQTYRSATTREVRLSYGLLVAFVTAVACLLLYWLGVRLGDLLRFEAAGAEDAYDSYNIAVMLGIIIVVAVKMVLPYLRREPQLPAFDIASRGGLVSLAVVSATNPLLLGVGVGFVGGASWSAWLVGGVVFLLSYFGLMFGRQEVALRPRRWAVFATLLLLVAAVVAAVRH